MGEPYKLYSRCGPAACTPIQFESAARREVERIGCGPYSAELTPIGVFLALGSLSWSYDSRLVGRAILIFFGASLVVRALLPQTPAEPRTT